jgi:hypothetical protein
MGDSIKYLGLFLIVIITGMEEFIDDFMFNIPVLKQAGTILYGIWTENPQLVLENVTILLGSLGLPLVLLFGNSKFGSN